MNIPYNSIYDEAISDRVLQKVGKSKFKNLGNAPSSKLNDFELQIVEELESDIVDLSTSLLKLLKVSRKEFKNLEKSSLKLKLKNRSYFKPFKQSLFADGISSSYGTVSDVSFPGKFGKIIDEIRLKCNELQDIFDGSDYKSYYNRLPKNLQNSKEIWKSLNLDNTSSFNYGNIRNWIKLGITPANSNGFYRLHATNAPPDAFKSSTGGIGIGKYMYLAVIHNCGHGFTDGSSDDALKVWNHVVKKRNDVYSFMAEDELGKDLVLAISTLLPKKSVLQLLNAWILKKNYNNKLSKEYASFFGWLKYRYEENGDTPDELLDDGLYELFKTEIQKLNFSTTVVQNTNVSSNTNTPSDTASNISSLEIVDVSNLEWKNEEPYEKSWYQAVEDTPKGYRLPTVQELHSSIKSGTTGFKRDDYWSSTTFFVNDGYGYYVYNNPSQIDVDIADKRAYPKKVRYVKKTSSRNTQISNTNITSDSITNRNDTRKITDISNLMWLDHSRAMSWHEAVRNTPKGYRLPTIRELYTAHIQNTQEVNSLRSYWSSTTDGTNPVRAWDITMGSGDITSYHKDTESGVIYVKEVSNRNTTTTSNTNTRILNRDQAKQIVDVSNLLTSVIQNREYSWDQAKDLERRGWRLPTIQELYTISEQRATFNVNLNGIYWSSSEKDNDLAWGISTSPGYVNVAMGEKYRKAKIMLVKRR